MSFLNISFLRLTLHTRYLQVVQNAVLKNSGLKITLVLGRGVSMGLTWGLEETFRGVVTFPILIGIWVKRCVHPSKLSKCTHFMKFYTKKWNIYTNIDLLLMTYMPKYLEGSILISAVYLEMHQRIRWIDGWDGYICDKKVKSRIKMVSIWVFTIKFFQLCCICLAFFIIICWLKECYKLVPLRS